jgi:drug/metabolite transporter (DMT)-like permease
MRLGVICWFYAMTRIPIAEVTAMNYLNPIYVTVLAVFVLGERISARRALAILFALAGAMVILRPGFRELDPGHIAMLFTAGFFAVGYLVTKILADEVPAAVVVFMLSVVVPSCWPRLRSPSGCRLAGGIWAGCSSRRSLRRRGTTP